MDKLGICKPLSVAYTSNTAEVSGQVVLMPVFRAFRSCVKKIRIPVMMNFYVCNFFKERVFFCACSVLRFE